MLENRKQNRCLLTHFTRKTWLFISLIVWSLFISFLLLQNASYSIFIEKLSISVRNKTVASALAPTAKRYFVDTPGCRMPMLDVMNKDIAKFLKKYEVKCLHGKPLTTADNQEVWIGLTEEEMERYYNISDFSLLVCQAWTFERDTDQQNRHHDQIVRTFQYGERIAVAGDQYVKVVCNYDGQKQIYEDAHAFVARATKSKKPPASQTPPFNVVIFGIDSISRLNFYRQMNETWKLLKKLGAIELQGYNKVDDNSFPNLMPVLTGYNYSELAAKCLRDKTTTFDGCPMIWDAYKSKGYRTMFAEDSQWMGLFNYAQTGYKQPPTDYYPRNFFLELERTIGAKQSGNGHVCMGARRTIDLFVDYVRRVYDACRSEPLFAFTWSSVMTHDWFESIAAADKDVWRFLNYLSWTNYLNDTVLFMFSDHGLRFGDFRMTYQGMIEERQPFLVMLAPEWLQALYPRAFGNFRANSKRLTAHYDLHETMKDLANVTSMTDAEIVRRSRELTKGDTLPRGISLFLSIPETRTCAMAGIKEHWCTCHEQRALQTKSAIAQIAAHAIVDHINGLLANYPQCERLTLNNVTDASLSFIAKSNDADDQRHANAKTADVVVSLETRPGWATFEGTIRVNYKNETHLAGPISRTNKYGTQSWCVPEPNLKLYCFCKRRFSE